MTDLWSLLTTSAYQPFTIAFFLMVGIGLIEAVGLGLGEFPDFHADLDIDGHAEGLSLLGWLGFGSGVPILIWLTSLLACFVLTGFVGQQLITAYTGVPLSGFWAGLGAGVIALIANTYVSHGLARILPKEETTALYPEDLLMYRGTVLTSPASRGKPSRVKVVDQFGQAHYLSIEPHDDQAVLPVGDTVLLVRKSGSLFFGQSDTPAEFRAIDV